MRTFSSWLNLGCASNPARSLGIISSPLCFTEMYQVWWLIPAVEAEILLEKIRDFQKCFQMPQGYIAANDGRSLGYAIKDLLSYLQKSQNKVDDQEFLFGLLLSRTMVELTYCISLKKNTQGVIYFKKACDYIDKHFLEEISIPEIAAYVDINKSYLQALFTDKIGCTINHYINQKRLEQAVFLPLPLSYLHSRLSFL